MKFRCCPSNSVRINWDYTQVLQHPQSLRVYRGPYHLICLFGWLSCAASYQALTASWHEVSWGTELYEKYRFSPALAFGSCFRDPILARWFAQCWALRARLSSHVSGGALCIARLVLWASRHALESTSNHVCKNILKNYWIKGKKTELKEKIYQSEAQN